MSLHFIIPLTLLIISSLVSTTTSTFPYIPQQTMAQIEDEVEEEDSQTTTTTTITTDDLTTYANSKKEEKIKNL